MKNILYVLLVFYLSSGFLMAQDSTLNYPSRSNIQSNLKSFVIKTDSIYQYNYLLINSKKSEQSIQEFYVEYFASIINTSSPENWVSLLSIKPLPVVIWGSNDKIYDLNPNNKLSGFSLESKGLPKILNFYIAGYVQEPEFDKGKAPSPRAITGLNIFENSLKGESLGPWQPDSSLSSKDFTDTLETFQKRSCEELGWIDNQGICNSLQVKLRNVRCHLERDKPKQARNVLHAFINEVEAQRGKHISEEGYALLYFNAEYLMNKLGSGKEN